MLFSRILALSVAVALAGPLSAHEFWIDADNYQVEAGGTLQGNFKNGQKFKGNTLSYFDRNATRFEMLADGERTSLIARNGDAPALNVAAPISAGLVVVVHETTPAILTYREWAKFEKFANHKDFRTALQDHIAAGWPKEDFRESYTRHAKILLAVGQGEGADEAFGLKTEFIAITNPYGVKFNNQMEVKLLLDGTIRKDAQVEVFDRDAAGNVTITLYRTNQDGIAVVPVTPGHEYLFDAVTLRKAPNAGTDPKAPVWETLWAALTFSVPQ